MFSRFLTDSGALFIQTQHIISIVDHKGVCRVTWSVDGDTCTAVVLGTAQENFDRLRAEELELINAAHERQVRADRGLPVLPVPRGKAVPR